MKRIKVEKDSYFDSVFLMLINKEVKQLEGVEDAVVAMGTEVNLDLLKELGFTSPEIESATPNDLIIAVQAPQAAVLEKALHTAGELLRKKKSRAGEEEEYRPVSLETALKILPEANLLIVSIPGAYAAREARKALENGLHVMLFSDNVSLEEEIELKKLASERGLLMMGPDCGTAIINGKPLCFANVVRRGDIGLVAASGTGLQEVTCGIDKLGGGVSQGIGTGGRDLKNARVGGLMMRMGIEALKNDPSTRVIVVISKPPAEEAAGRIIDSLEASGKPAVIHFIGLKGKTGKGNLHYAGNLEEAAEMAVALSRGEEHEPRGLSLPREEVERIVERERARLSPGQKYLRGLYAGGTLADEALILFEREIGGIYSNIQTDPDLMLPDPHSSQCHTIVDLGEDVFTVGRPHPMIDPSTRTERIEAEIEDTEVAVLLLDCVLGYGSHPDPAGAMAEHLKRARRKVEERGGFLPVVASVTGTAGDPQDLEEQKRKLKEAGCLVMPSNYQASLLALEIIRKAGGS